MTHLALTRTDGRPIAGTMAAGPQQAWEWVAGVVARLFDCLPEDVGYDEDNLVTVGGEAVAVLTIHAARV